MGDPVAGRPDLSVLVLACAVLGLLLFPAHQEARRRAARRDCANHLRRLGLAAHQYSDDKRFFPHVAGMQQLDGDCHDAGPTTTTKAVRTMLWYGYTESAEDWICPSSRDTYRPVYERATQLDPQRWFWGGRYGAGSATLSPLVDGADPAVIETDELSYGWTRKGLNRGTRSTTLVAADRAVAIPERRDLAALPGQRGNHAEGWNVLFADAVVAWHQADSIWPIGGYGRTPTHVRLAELLSATGSNGDGFLAVLNQEALLPLTR